MKREMKMLSDEQEAEVADMALALLDRCRALVASQHTPGELTAEQLLSTTMCVAIQSVFLAEPGTNRVEDGMSKLDRDYIAALYHGLGAGVGHCLGAIGTSNGISMAHQTYADALGPALEMRSELSMRGFIKAALRKGKK